MKGCHLFSFLFLSMNHTIYTIILGTLKKKIYCRLKNYKIIKKKQAFRFLSSSDSHTKKHSHTDHIKKFKSNVIKIYKGFCHELHYIHLNIFLVEAVHLCNRYLKRNLPLLVKITLIIRNFTNKWQNTQIYMEKCIYCLYIYFFKLAYGVVFF